MANFPHDDFSISDPADGSKILSFNVSPMTTGTGFQRTVSAVDYPGVMVLADAENSGGTLKLLFHYGSSTTAPTWSAPSLPDDLFRIEDNADSAKKIAFQASGITSGNTRTWTAPDKDLTWDYGTYTPTRSAEANLDANVTPSQFQYMRVGNVVTVSGRVTAVDPTLTATATSYELTLPIASNIGAVEDCAGTAFCGAIAGMGAAITGSVANNTAVVSWISSDITSQAWSLHFTYEVI